MHFSPSLVKYSTPVLISTGVKKKGQKEEEKKNNKPKYYDWKDSKVDKTVNIWDWVLDMEKGQTIEQILNTILIPREFHLENQGQVWIQTAISVPATRTEVRTLQGRVQKANSFRGAKKAVKAKTGKRNRNLSYQRRAQRPMFRRVDSSGYNLLQAKRVDSGMHQGSNNNDNRLL